MHRRSYPTLIPALTITFTLALAGSTAIGEEFQGQEPRPNVTAEVGAPTGLTRAWEGGKVGTLIGVGAGASVALIHYGVGGNPRPLRLIAGTTGAGFLVGALWGIATDLWGNPLALNKPPQNRGNGTTARMGNFSPTILASGSRAFAGWTATLEF